MNSLNRIDHFVVLMLENRSFDNLLGNLYPGRADFAGLTGDETNPDVHGSPIRVWSNTAGRDVMSLPTPDPGEIFTDINEQLFGDKSTEGIPLMSGFAANYAKQPNSDPRDIMHCFLPEQLPAFSALARSYAVCDHWFASAPCQTWPNRFFVHTATANGYENNSPAHFPYTMPTIFNALEDKAEHGWKVYFHDFPQALTLARLWPHLDRFRRFEEFLDDARKGTLPSYSFIEPRYFADADWPNDMHPPHHIGYADELIAHVYNALRESACWQSTMLIVTFDEHGGCYDHVPPPAAPSPEAPRPDQRFAFNRFGVRVPAIVASPFVRPGMVFRAPEGMQPFDHTSIIKTLRTRFGIDAPLTARDKNAPDLGQVLTLEAPSNEGRELVNAVPTPRDEEGLARARMAPLNDFQKALHDSASRLHELDGAKPTDADIGKIFQAWPSAASHANSSVSALGRLHLLLEKFGIVK